MPKPASKNSAGRRRSSKSHVRSAAQGAESPPSATGDAVASSVDAKVSGRYIAALLAILLLAAGVRSFGIDRNGLWLDEVWTLALTAGNDFEAGLPINTIIEPPASRVTGLADAVPWWRVAGEMGTHVTHPPLYYVLLRIWREAFGEGDIAARMMSVFFSLVAVLLVYDVGRLLFGRSAGLWAALLMAIAPPQVLFAQEARNYTIQLALALAAASALLRIERAGASWPGLLGLCAALLALVMSHYFALGAAIALAIYAAVNLRGRTRWLALGAMAAAALLFLLIWGPAMWQQRQAFAVNAGYNAWLYDTAPGRPLRALADLMLIPARLLGVSGAPWLAIGYIAAAAYALPLLLWRRRRELLLPWLWLACILGVLLVLDVMRSSRHLEHVRYALLAGPGLYLLIAGMLAHLPRWQHIPPALATLVCIAALPAAWHEADLLAEDWRGAAAYIRANAQSGDVVVLSSESAVPYYSNIAYLGLSHYLGSMPGPFVLAQERPSPLLLAQLRQRSSGGRTIWLVTVPAELDPNAVLPGVAFRERGDFVPVVLIWRGAWASSPPP